MSLNTSPLSERIHIGLFGNTNSGKSSLINALTGQSLSIVSDIKGTTTDPVYKTMELLPLGPVVFIDTAGLDDTSNLSNERIGKTMEEINRIHIGIIVLDGTLPLDNLYINLSQQFTEKNIPHIFVINKCDLGILDSLENDIHSKLSPNATIVKVSSKTRQNIDLLKDTLGKLKCDTNTPIIRDKIHPLTRVLLVIPLDKSAPKGRLILPQQLVIRDILDSGGVITICRDNELEYTIKNTTFDLVITDSQIFGKVAKTIPNTTLLTSFSILMARYKGNLISALRGAYTLDMLNDNSKILISEGCTHHRQCGDIGTNKLPIWIKNYTGLSNIDFHFTSGKEFPKDISQYSLIIHCGGCMLNENEMQFRYKFAEEASIPITNYGTLIAHINGILSRALSPFPEINKYLS